MRFTPHISPVGPVYRNKSLTMCSSDFVFRKHKQDSAFRVSGVLQLAKTGPPVTKNFPFLRSFPSDAMIKVVTRYMGSGIKGLKKGGIRDHSQGSGITTPAIGISGVFHWIRDQAFWITKGIHDLTGFLSCLKFYVPFHTAVLGIWTS